MKNVVALVLGGGRGTRSGSADPLPLQAGRAAGGKYRLIDIPLSNCINSRRQPDLRAHAVPLGQPAPPHPPDLQLRPLHGGFVEILAAQQTMEAGTDWYQGTADAVRKNLRYLKQPGSITS